MALVTFRVALPFAGRVLPAFSGVKRRGELPQPSAAPLRSIDVPGRELNFRRFAPRTIAVLTSVLC